MDAQIHKNIEDFFSSYSLRSYRKDLIFVHADTEPEGIFYLSKGFVRQYDITETGSEIVVNVFKPPSFFPMTWAINNTPNQYFYETETECEVRIAPPAEVLSFLKDNPEVMFDLLKRVYSGLSGMQRRMAHLMGGTSQSRLLYELVLECERFGHKINNSSYTLTLTENEIASRAGLSRETVSRIIKKLKQQGRVRVQHGTITVLNLPELKKLLGSDL